MTLKRDIALANRLQSILAKPMPVARVIALWHEELQLSREAQADSYRVIRRHIKAIAELSTLTPYERTKLAQAEAMIESSRASRRAYEADLASTQAQNRQRAKCGPAKAIQGRAFYAVLKAKHDSSEYIDVNSDGVYSHSEAVSGPGVVDSINVMSTRLPSTDSTAEIGLQRALNGYRVDMDRCITTASKLSARSHRRSSKRGRRNRGKGGKGQVRQ